MAKNLNRQSQQISSLKAQSLAPNYSTYLLMISFFFIETIALCSYEDNNTMYSSDKDPNIVISRFRHDLAIISEWFYENFMVLNTYKYYFLTVRFNEPFSDFSFNDTNTRKRFLRE